MARLALSLACLAGAAAFVLQQPPQLQTPLRREHHAPNRRLASSRTHRQGRRRRPLPSKSLSNRALLLAALCEGETVVENLLASDTERMLEALDMGVKVKDSATPLGESPPRDR